jgi:F-type H+-transporting ATPase subunit gamma
VQSTKKITRAMELIAATRVVKAQQRANAARPYAAKITGVIEDLAAAGTGVDHPLLRDVDQVRRTAYVIITSDRGLAGPYNSAVIRAAERELQARQLEGTDYSLVLIGKKAQDYFRFRNYRIDHAFSGMTDTPRYEQAREVALVVRQMFEAAEVDQVLLAYQEFISLGTQRVALRRFLPLESMEVVATEGSGTGAATALFEFEPSPRSVLGDLLPRYVESRLFSALLDASASEHASRQRAMKAATDNAEELIVKLTRQMNRARQDAITTEIMEIVGGAEALRADAGSPADLLIDHLFGEHLFPQTLAAEPVGHATGAHLAGAAVGAPEPRGLIKGNMDSMYYHRPDSRSYGVTKAEVWFETEEEAQAAGFTLAPTHPNPPTD